MPENTNVNVVPTLSTGTLLGILFVTLKLTHIIAWPWWLVLLPFYAGIVLALLFLAFVVGIAAFVVGIAALVAFLASRS